MTELQHSIYIFGFIIITTTTTSQTTVFIVFLVTYKSFHSYDIHTIETCILDLYILCVFSHMAYKSVIETIDSHKFLNNTSCR
jgi:hypothetical protein